MSTSATPPAKKLVDDFSLEMTGKDVEALEAAAHLIPQGTRINVTFLGNEDLDMRTNAAAAVRRLGFDPVPHISARRISSESELTDFLQALKEAAAPTKVFAVGGDPETPMGPYEDSLSLIETGLFPQYGITEVNIAGYPEGTPVIADDVLWDHLQRKDRALKEQGLDGTILTQFSFDTDPVTQWISDVRNHGVDLTIRVGVPGPAGIKRLLNYAKRFGVASSAGIAKKYGLSLTNLLGTAGPDRFINDLASELTEASGDVKLHFYTFGGLSATAEWIQDFRR
ncbi:methylenetetrahydrofolate reductase [Neomicrococcus lactis]|uniref:methylenetetrahydrofolate reductase n=1 Tax=Neomicrococcus lactis TaxID=732241 RepID=UPI002301F647|nr:methylenetetrahydrofolate reductase [Neomicrococcus lactis]